jgi:uncharacterized protein YndB with AHSA1/START domain
MIDATHEVNATRRRVGARALDVGEVNTVTIGKTYDAPLDDVWDACTNPARIPRWFLPVSGELRLGGRYKLEGNAGGTIEACDPPNGFAATWEYGGDVSWIELRLTGDPQGGTRFELEHIGAAGDEKWGEFGPGALGVGWDLGLTGLRLHLASGAAVDPAEGAAWVASEDGRQFVSLSSRSWCDAHVAAGADAAVAQAAADRTVVAYTGPS